ncbi:MAG: MFS transporter [Caulobacteraceae bacterium]
MAGSAADGAQAEGVLKGASMRTIVAASSAGTAFEWYDFFIFGSLTTLIGKLFFANLDPTTGVIFALGVFGAGFLFRPVGALVFGWVGDRMGRKGAFLVTVSLMGLATLAVGFLPTYSQVGILAPTLLLVMRLIQGFALGGEYGGAAVYVAEHAPEKRRGEYTGWIQISASFGLIGALGVIYVTRTIVGVDAFNAWGWRIPFFFSAFLLAISLWMRLKLSESPVFKSMEAAGGRSRAPFAEAFGKWRYLKIVILALFAIMVAQGVVWYTIFFYSQTFMERILKVDSNTVTLLVLAATVISAPLYVFFAWLSDRIGRKPVMLFGMLLGIIALFPLGPLSGFHLLTQYANPALAAANDKTPVTVVADPADCALQFDPVGKTQFTSSCDIAKSTLANAGVSYENQAAPAGTIASVHVGQSVVASDNGTGLPAAKFKALQADVGGRIKAALKAAGYPDKADPAQVDFKMLLAVMTVLVIAATALYGPIASCLVELFPTRIRYTAMSLPYNIGTGWVGGFVPFISFAMVVANGNAYFGLWYPVLGTVLSFLVTLFFLPETRGRDINRAD